ncbi:hypothetical protein ACJX0J_015446, partial [Zea mays]
MILCLGSGVCLYSVEKLMHWDCGSTGFRIDIMVEEHKDLQSGMHLLTLTSAQLTTSLIGHTCIVAMYITPQSIELIRKHNMGAFNYLIVI